MKKPFFKIITFTLALLVLISTLSFSVEKHFCGDFLVDMTFFIDAEKCTMETRDIMKKKLCCKDVVDVVLGQDELKLASLEDFEFKQQQLFTSFVFSYYKIFENLPNTIISLNDYSPPSLIFDIQVLDQVFLI